MQSCWSIRHAAILLIALLVGATGMSHTETPQVRFSRESPFRGVDASRNVTTSNDEYRIWVHWYADRFEAQYPDREGDERHVRPQGGPGLVVAQPP